MVAPPRNPAVSGCLPISDSDGAWKDMPGVGITEIIVLLIVAALAFDPKWLACAQRRVRRDWRKIQEAFPALAVGGADSADFVLSSPVATPVPDIHETIFDPSRRPLACAGNPLSNRPHDHTRRWMSPGPPPPPSGNGPADSAPEHRDGPSDLSVKMRWNELLRYLKDDILYASKAPGRWKSQDWLTRGGVAGGIAALSSLDERTRGTTRANQFDRAEIFRTYVQPFGRSQTQLAVIAAFLAAGRMKDKSEWMDTGFLCLEALVLTGCTVLPLKVMLGRKRPRDTANAFHFDLFSFKNSSFPSGDTTSAFAMATVIAGRFRAPWVRWVVYTLGGLVAAARIYRSRHWLSDTLAGIAFGQTIGKYTLIRHGERMAE